MRGDCRGVDCRREMQKLWRDIGEEGAAIVLDLQYEAATALLSIWHVSCAGEDSSKKAQTYLDMTFQSEHLHMLLLGAAAPGCM